jgi:K(+)-stimulated pyrophosphate-energized sodium pump
MREISELIYETCKTYLVTQGKFLLILEIFIGSSSSSTSASCSRFEPMRVLIILLFSLIGHRRELRGRVVRHAINTFANSRTAFASLAGRPLPVYAIPLESGMSIGMLLISVELFLMLCILLFVPGEYAGPASSDSRSASPSARRPSGSRRHLHEDRGHRL